VPKFIPSTAVIIAPNPLVCSVSGLTIEEIPVEIRYQYDRGVAGTKEAFEARQEIGRLLGEARALFSSDTLFGQWVAEQNFPFARGQVVRLQQEARLAPYMREALAHRGASEDTINYSKLRDEAKELAVADGAWTAPSPKFEPEGEDDLQEPTAQLVLQAMFEDLPLGNFLILADKEWLEVTRSQRLIASEFFKKVASRMLEVHALWKATA
jgi:hypothetical protein